MGAALSSALRSVEALVAAAVGAVTVLIVGGVAGASRGGGTVFGPIRGGAGARVLQYAPSDETVVSGVGLGLPGVGRRVFDRRNAAALLRGECLIERLDARGVDALLKRRVCQLKKDGARGATKVPIRDPAQTIGVSARLGAFDLAAEYGVPGPLCLTMGKASQIAVAAGLEALKDAGLVSGDPDDGANRWKIDERFRDGTGVVYATSFPALDAALAEAHRYGEHGRPHRQSAATLLDALERRLGQLPRGARAPDVDAALATLRDAAGAAPPSPAGSPRREDLSVDAWAAHRDTKPYGFDRKFLFKVLVLGNSQLAQISGARGPNLQSNAACAGTTQAVGLAHDLLRAGRCDRVVVISGDDASGDALMPWIGNGFNALGAASVARDPRDAARPFDARRSGMVVGAAACALVIERALPAPYYGLRGLRGRSAASRAVAPRKPGSRPRRARCRVLETLYSNSAYHGAAMCGAHIASELEAFLVLSRVEIKR